VPAKVLLGVITVFLCGLCIPLRAQLTSSTLAGTVYDPTGAAVRDCTVTATSLSTGAVRTTQSESSGYYTIPSLQPGQYTLKATATGFETATSQVTVVLNQASSFDFHLTVGSSNQTVVVDSSATALQLETEGHQVGNFLDEKSVENLPANGRDLFQVLESSPNVYGNVPATNSDINYYAGNFNNSLQIGGTAAGTTTYLENGVDNFNMLVKGVNLQPTIEAVQEVSLIASGASARFDEPSVVNVVTKAGTNTFHGRLYDYFRNDALNTVGYFNVPKPPLRYNQFGANIGGPILRNKVFFFFDYAGLRTEQGQTLFAYLPTAAERAGDFSQDSYTLYDPETYNPQTGAIHPFPGNKIPAARITNFSNLYLGYYPLPTGSVIANDNYQTNASNTTTYDSYLGRIDYNISANDTIYGTYETADPLVINPSIAAEFYTLSTNGAINSTVQETHTFSPRLVNIGRFGYNQSSIEITEAAAGKQNYVAQYGIQNLNPEPLQYTPPAVSLVGHTTAGNPYYPDGAHQKLLEFADEFDWTRGRHTIYVGGEVDKIYFHGNWGLWNNGAYSFSGQYTADHNLTNPTGGQDIADLLLGYPTSATGGNGVTIGDFHQWNVIPYIQDDWRVSNKLTLNLGLRYDYYQSPYDVNGHSNVYDVPTNTNHKGTFHQNYWNFAPRIGFAYSLDSATVVHGGYGIYYAPFMYDELQYLLANPPNFVLQSYTYPLTTLAPVTTTFVANPMVSGLAPFTTMLVMSTPYVQQWNLAIQRKLGSDWIATVAYLGSTFQHGEMRTNPNQASPPTDPNNPSPINSRRPYSWIGDVDQASDIGYSNYNGLQAELTHRFSYGLSLDASYVWSKAMDEVSGDNNSPEYGPNPALDYGPTDFNSPQVFKLTSVYELPVGTGRRYLGSTNRFTDEILGGWQVSDILSVVSGAPFSVFATDLSDTGSFHIQRANQVCNGNNPQNQSIREWFNTSCYVQPGPGQLGNLRRNNLTSPRTTDLDLSLMKNFPLFKEDMLQFRSDFFDIFNHPLLYVPNSSQSVGSSTYGQITDIQGSRIIQFSLKILF
jgi:outer membrane receptor protein involved in Fe transport